jgi:hypothetical protein
MQRVHAEDDLFERAGRHGADEDRVEAGERIGAVGDRGGDAAEVQGCGVVTEQGGGAQQIADVPTIAGAENCDTHGALCFGERGA